MTSAGCSNSAVNCAASLTLIPPPTARIRVHPPSALSDSTATIAANRPDRICGCRSYGRRGLLFMSTTLPILFPTHELGGLVSVEAKELVVTNHQFIKELIRKVLSKTNAAGVLRLVFHDAGTFESVDSSVSWADMIAMGGAEAVSLCGGPNILVQLGRLDSAIPDPEGKLPEETLDAYGLKQCFERKGFSTQELVALSGAHTLGSKGFGNPTVFDNSYYKILLEKSWLSSAGMSSMIGLPSDRALVEDNECLRWITRYADDQDAFFEDFKNAYIKLVNSGAKWKTA
ncbi:putative L-ascorbate peroxidase 6 [Drosera capensis]